MRIDVPDGLTAQEIQRRLQGRKLPELMKPGEAAEMLLVDVKTLSRWAQAGTIRSVKTPGVSVRSYGHNRYFRAEIEALAVGQPLTEAQLDALVRGES